MQRYNIFSVEKTRKKNDFHKNTKNIASDDSIPYHFSSFAKSMLQNEHLYFNKEMVKNLWWYYKNLLSLHNITRKEQ